jgi:hypothetical protein
MRTLKCMTAAAAIAGSVATSSMTLRAEETSHEQHHPSATTQQEPQEAKPDAATKPDSAGQGKMGGGMMGGDHMPKMMKMMEEMRDKMKGSAASMQPKGDTGPSSQAFNGIMIKMHQDMAVTYTGNADTDFVKAMIPHHQAALDMAKTVLAFGKDGDVKKLAEDVVEAQEKQITKMKEWLKKQSP